MAKAGESAMVVYRIAGFCNWNFALEAFHWYWQRRGGDLHR